MKQVQKYTKINKPNQKDNTILLIIKQKKTMKVKDL